MSKVTLITKMAYIFYSVNPDTGLIDVYPKWLTEEATLTYQECLDTGKSTTIAFGSRFFGATLHFDHNGNHRQTSSNGGLRSVGVFSQNSDLLPDAKTYTTTVMCSYGEWRIARGNQSMHETHTREAVIPPEYTTDDPNHKKVPFWEWCRVTARELRRMVTENRYSYSMTLKRLPEEHWFAYDQSQTARLEEAWATGESSAVVEVGVRQYTVAFDTDRVFARQYDSIDPTRIRIARRNPNMSLDQVKTRQREAMKHVADIDKDEVCSICINRFDEYMPVITLECGHIFHAACITPMILQTIRNAYGEPTHHCPMCRAEFTTEQYESIIGCKVVAQPIGAR